MNPTAFKYKTDSEQNKDFGQTAQNLLYIFLDLYMNSVHLEAKKYIHGKRASYQISFHSKPSWIEEDEDILNRTVTGIWEIDQHTHIKGNTAQVYLYPHLDNGYHLFEDPITWHAKEPQLPYLRRPQIKPLRVFSSKPIVSRALPRTEEREYAEYLKKINGFTFLEVGWDGYDADPIKGAVIEKTLNYVRLFYKAFSLIPSFTAPTPDSNILVEFSNKTNTKKARLEFSTSEKFHCRLIDNDKTIMKEDGLDIFLINTFLTH